VTAPELAAAGVQDEQPSPAAALMEELAEELERLPPARAAALAVVQVVDDPETSAADVAKAAQVDAMLTARLLCLANSAYYGLSGRVTSAAFAVTVIGFQAVRSLASMSVAGLMDEADLPPGHWRRSATVAAGASLVARRTGADQPAAFCVGILHDLGAALLWRHARERQEALLARATPSSPVHVLERAEYGADHAQLCAGVLASWHFPEDLCTAIGRHHEPPGPAASPLRRALQAGIALADLAEHRAGRTEAKDALDAAFVRGGDVVPLVEQVRVEGEQLSAALTGR
jgi:HD-like signal output (HDOD) protein